MFEPCPRSVRLITRDSEEYPPLLRKIDSPPLVLYAVGERLGSRCYIAVAGTREPSQRGAELAYSLGRELAKRDYSVVTGGARGVDAYAWEGARSVGGHVVVVAPFLFKGVDPWRCIERRETMVAEVLDPTRGPELSKRQLFVIRNRIIVSISAAVVIPDVRCKIVGNRCRESGWGTRYTAAFGLRERRPVVVIEPKEESPERRLAFQHLLDLGAIPAKDLGEALRIVENEAGKRCAYAREAIAVA